MLPGLWILNIVAASILMSREEKFNGWWWLDCMVILLSIVSIVVYLNTK
jgi:hypothetical protein